MQTQEDLKLPIDGEKEDDELSEADVREEVMVLAESTALVEEVETEQAVIEMREVDGGQVPIVTLIKAGPNTRGTKDYTPEFLQQCIAEGRFTHSYSYLNHPTREEKVQRPERDMTKLAGHTGEAFWDEAEQAVKAPFEFLAEDNPLSMGRLAKDLFSSPVVRARSGLSIYYDGPVAFKEVSRQVGGDKRTVMQPVRLGSGGRFDVDIVTQPGAGGGFGLLEADREPPQEEDEDMDLSTLTPEQLREARPDLVEALQEADPAKPDPERVTNTAEGSTAAPQATDVAAIVESAVSAFEKRLDEKLAEAVAPYKQKFAAMDAGSWFDKCISEAGVSEREETFLRGQFDGKVFESRETFDEAFKGAVESVKALREPAFAGVAGLGASDAAEDGEQKTTLAEAFGWVGGDADNG